MAPVTTPVASHRTLSSKAESRLWQLFQITSPYSIRGLIRVLYKHVEVDLSTLYLTNFSIFNRLEAFLYILTIWFLHHILLCKVRPKWVWDSTSLTTLVSRNRGGWSCILRLRENTTLRGLTGFIATNQEQPTRRSYLDKNLGNQLRRLAREQCSIIGINQRKRGEITSNIIDINKKIEAVLSKTLEGLHSWLFANQRIALLYWTTHCFRLSN